MHDGPTSEPTSTIGQVVDQLQQRIDALPPDQVLAVGDGRAATRVMDQGNPDQQNGVFRQTRSNSDRDRTNYFSSRASTPFLVGFFGPVHAGA
jgi:hypothetical protein